MRFKKKPVEIEARQFHSKSFDQMQDLVRWINLESGCERAWHDGHVINIDTLEGWHTASVGDWIIKGVAGEFYPCKPSIFEKTYEPI